MFIEQVSKNCRHGRAALALIALLACSQASAALVEVTITGTFNGTDHYGNTWPTVQSTNNLATAITNQAYTARIVYDTSYLTEARDGYPANSSWGAWDNLTNFGNSQVYDSFVVSADVTLFGQTIALDTTWGSQFVAIDQAGASTDTFQLTGSDKHRPAGDTVDDEHVSVYVSRPDLFPAPFVASEAPTSPLALILTPPAGSSYIDFKLYDYPACATVSTDYSLPATRNCPADRFTDSAIHWVDGSGTVASITIAPQVVPLPGAFWLLGSAFGVVGWLQKHRAS
jgi:hypothetical protein